MQPGKEAPVLVVEDNATNQLAIGALLDRFGVNADFVSNGPQAVVATETKRYRLVLMDVMLPGMDGYATARHIRRLEYGTGRHTPIVAVTAVDTSISKPESIAAGMDGFIGKPIDRDELAGVLRTWVARPLAATEDAGDAGRILASFLEVTGALLESLSTAIEAEDLAAASHLAHEVKASSLVAHAGEMTKMAKRLEQTIREEKWREIMDDYRDLVAAFRRTTEDLKRVQEILRRKTGHAMER
ncbi:MAG TPA: response regulator [Burkholderiales bacterium]|nr:response regulator [Burkholderiales bacterium]